MAAQPCCAGIAALLLDVEGTTTPIEFVHEILFPFARARLPGFLERHHADVAVLADLTALCEEHSADLKHGLDPPAWSGGMSLADVTSAVAYVQWLMDHDRKSTGLKSLQGRIWDAGYRADELRGRVYADVPAALQRWRRQGRAVAIFSSGSVLAQQLLFGHSEAGDLTPFIESYFDTSTGAKREAESYRRIAHRLGRSAAEVLFVSDVTAELDAAAGAGMQTALCVRGIEPQEPGAHCVVRTLDALCP